MVDTATCKRTVQSNCARLDQAWWEGDAAPADRRGGRAAWSTRISTAAAARCQACRLGRSAISFSLSPTISARPPTISCRPGRIHTAFWTVSQGFWHALCSLLDREHPHQLERHAAFFLVSISALHASISRRIRCRMRCRVAGGLLIIASLHHMLHRGVSRPAETCQGMSCMAPCMGFPAPAVVPMQTVHTIFRWHRVHIHASPVPVMLSHHLMQGLPVKATASPQSCAQLQHGFSHRR